MLQPLNEMIKRLELYVFIADLESLGVIHNEAVDEVELAGFVFLVLALTGESAVSPMRCGGILAPRAVVPIITAEGVALLAHTVKDRIVQAVALCGVLFGIDEVGQLIRIFLEIVKFIIGEKIDSKLISAVGYGAHRLESAIVIVVLLEAGELVEYKFGRLGIRVAAGIKDALALKNLRDGQTEEIHYRGTYADVRNGVLGVDRAALALGVTDDEGNARNVIIWRRTLGK